MAEKVIFDAEHKLILGTYPIVNGIGELDIKTDIYSDAKEDWRTNPLLNKFRFLFRVIGGDETVPPEKAPLFAYERYGWRLRPKEAPHTLILKNGTLLVDEDPSLSPIVPTLGDFNVLVRDVVPIRGTLVGVSGLTPEQSEQLQNSHSMLGGRQRTEGSQIIYYEEDNITEIARFNMYDKDGNLTTDINKAIDVRRVIE